MSKRNRERSKSFEKARKQHSSEAAEDYTELIWELTELQGSARVTELARHLGISHVTALRTTRRLANLGYIEQSKRAPLLLTAKGKRLALAARKRHTTLVAFLTHLGVPKLTAESDAEGIEHHVSSATLRAIERWLNAHT